MPMNAGFKAFLAKKSSSKAKKGTVKTMGKKAKKVVKMNKAKGKKGGY